MSTQHDVTLDAVSTPPVRPLEAHDARRSSVGECPVWRAEESALYWVDIPAQTLVRYAVDTARRTERAA
ncbi:SMP-30/gluconolactonase/LRE family protein [Paraburkholderia unamae]|uniref:SMP-30/gluconolactonase/LRE family protein n=1 Tax=Paraburkholderia unamae TaxID=219649 RepID=UPI003CCC7E7B